MTWIPLTDEKQLNDLIVNSNTVPQVIFKHSTRCSISSMAKNRLDREDAPDRINFYFLDLIKYRSLSNKIAHKFGISHQSPQVLVIQNGECVYNESHSGIDFEEIEAVVS
jgi:bacillithiol system protein YtxJ